MEFYRITNSKDDRRYFFELRKLENCFQADFQLGWKQIENDGPVNFFPFKLNMKTVNFEEGLSKESVFKEIRDEFERVLGMPVNIEKTRN